MKTNNIFLLITGLFITIFFLNCTTTQHYNFSLKNTLSIFLLNDGKDYYFSIPVQYIGDYQIENFEFNNGFILIGGYKILLNRNDMGIDVFVNTSSDEYGNTDGLHNVVYSQKNGRISISKMNEPLSIKNESGQIFNQYNIILEKYLKNSEMKKIINEYKKGNTSSNFYLEYTITIDNEQTECGYLDDFELYNGSEQEPSYLRYASFGSGFPPNLEFFRARVLEKR
jgi:hypothetical protein